MPLLGGSLLRDILCLLAVLLTLTPGCQNPAPTAQTSAPAPTAETQGADRPPGVAKVDKRAETQQKEQPVVDKTPTRTPAAEFIVTAPPASPPKLDGGERSPAAQSALAWLRGPWATTLQGGDKEGYLALLHQDFKGHTAMGSELVARDAWPQKRTPALGTTVAHGIEWVTANPSNTGGLEVKMRESLSDAQGCRVGQRTLGMRPTGSGTERRWTLTSEELSTLEPCPEVSRREVVAAHTALGVAWRGRDLSAVQAGLHGGFTLLDGGVEASQYNHAAMTTGAGRWVLDLVGESPPQVEAIRLVGDEAIIEAKTGSLLIYRYAGERWRLRALWRQTSAP